MPSPTRTRAILLIACLASLLAACAATLGPGQDTATRAVFEQLKRRDFAAIESRLVPSLRTAVTDARLQSEAALIPDAPPEAIKLVGFQSASAGGGRQTSVTREYFYPDRLLVVSTVIDERAGQPATIIAFNVQGFSRAALAIGRFGLTGKSTIQYFLLGLAIAIPLLLIYALASLARDKTIRLKWLWTLVILIGFTRLSVNWATGALLFQPLTAVLLGAAINRGPLDISPWIVSISVPLGALVYLGQRWFAPVVDEAG